MTNQVHDTDVLLSLWALEQQWPPEASRPTPQTCLFSGGQDSSTLAWLLYHTDAAPTHLLHCNHLWQDDNFFMTEHALRLSFWLGWDYTVALPPHHVGTEQDASAWRQTVTGQLSALRWGQPSCNGHTASDYYESAFFHFVRTITPDPSVMQATGEQRQHTDELPSSGDTTLSAAYTRTADVGSVREARPTVDATPRGGCCRGCVRVTQVREQRQQVVGSLWRPLAALARTETRLLPRIAQLPVYPDQTNHEPHTTRTQVRALILPLLARLGLSPPP